MTAIQLAFILAGLFIAILVVVGVVFLLKGENKTGNRDLRALIQSGQIPKDNEGFVEEVRIHTGSSATKPKKTEDLSSKLFKAGYFTPADKAKFYRLQMVLPIPLTIAFVVLAQYCFGQLSLTLLLGALGAFIGLAYPSTMLDRKIRARGEEILYYLPLIIEQLSIGVSSGLDIGPCISHIIRTADERGSHNPVTEMLMHVQKLIQAGLNLEDALIEVGEATGNSELKHAFMFLGQCAKHGGEVSRQLQDLADAVTMQKQIRVEARITALPVKATGPLAIVFMGFFVILLSAMFLKVIDSLNPPTTTEQPKNEQFRSIS